MTTTSCPAPSWRWPRISGRARPSARRSSSGHGSGASFSPVRTAQLPFPDDSETRLLRFAELVATAMSNAVSLAELAASRARIVATADETRRRIQRDLHDGAQQRLVSLALELRTAESKVPLELTALRAELAQMARELAAAVEDLQEISRGIHPAILSKGGLGPALKSLCGRAAIPVELDLRADDRLPESIEVAAYYVVSEALTNVAKHAHGEHARVTVEAGDGILEVAIRDHGVGGADPSRGSGLIGLRDRVEALGGTIHVESPPGKGTAIQVALPFTSNPSSSDHVRTRARPAGHRSRAAIPRTFPSRAWSFHWSWRCRSSWARWVRSERLPETRRTSSRRTR